MVTIFYTILAGVSVFVIGQIVLKWIIEPVQELRKLKGEILFHLANDYATIQNANTVEKQVALEAGKVLERLGASLLANEHLIPMYTRIQRIFSLPESESIKFAAKQLRLISKSMFSDAKDIHYRLDLYRIDVCEALNIDDPIKDGMSKQELKDAISEMRQQSRS